MSRPSINVMGLAFTYSVYFQERKASLLAHRDKCPESYCLTLCVGIGIYVHVDKNFNLAYGMNNYR